MHNRIAVARILVALLCIAIAGFGFTATAQAGPVGTQEYLAAEEAAEAREKISAHLERDEVRDALISQGVAPDQVEERIAAMTDSEVIELADRMDEMPAGGSVSSVVTAALIVFLVLLLTDILGHTDVFPFTR